MRIEPVKRILRTIVGLFPLRLPGIALLALGYLAWRKQGQGHADYVLYAAGLVGMGIVALCTVFVIAAAIALAIRLRKRDGRVEGSVDAGVSHETGFAFPRLTLWPLVTASMTWDEPAGARVEVYKRSLWELGERVRFTRRGRLESVVRRFCVEDLFGLASVSFPRRAPATLRVLPARAAIDRHSIERKISGDGVSHPSGEPVGDYVEMRPYAPGDPVRHVLWKTFARTRRLLVRVPERALTIEPDPVGFLIAAPDDEATASVARTFVEDGVLGQRLLFAADGATQPARSTAEAIDQVVASARAPAEKSGEGLGYLLQAVDAAQLGNCVVFVPNATPGPWVARLGDFCRQVPQPPTCVLGVDLGDLDPSSTPRRPSLLKRLLVAGSGAPADETPRFLPAPVLELSATLQRFGADVRVVDRKSGQLLGPETLNRMARL